MATDAPVLETAAEAPAAAAPALDAGAAAGGPAVATIELDRATRSMPVDRAPSPCTRFAWGAAAAGFVLFAAAMLQAAGTWALSAGAVALTVAAIAGVIAMEGCEQPVVGRRPVTVRHRRPPTRTW